MITIDEAQLFFPLGSNRHLGKELKRLLELNWSTEKGDLVSVLFAMIGLPSLPERAPDLPGVLLPKR